MRKEYSRPKEQHKQRHEGAVYPGNIFFFFPLKLENKEEWREDDAGKRVGARL